MLRQLKFGCRSVNERTPTEPEPAMTIAEWLALLDSTGTVTVLNRKQVLRIHRLRPLATLEQVDTDEFRFTAE